MNIIVHRYSKKGSEMELPPCLSLWDQKKTKQKKLDDLTLESLSIVLCSFILALFSAIAENRSTFAIPPPIVSSIW